MWGMLHIQSTANLQHIAVQPVLVHLYSSHEYNLNLSYIYIFLTTLVQPKALIAQLEVKKISDVEDRSLIGVPVP